jgi:DNA-binding transcriptional MerR regulator
VSNLYTGLLQYHRESGQARLTTGEVARIFGVHPSSVRRWCEQGKIKASLTEGAWTFTREDVAVAYLDRSIQRCLDSL